MIAHLSYVACDNCGAPGSAPVGDAREARMLVNEGWVRQRSPLRNKTEDWCPPCARRILKTKVWER